MNALQPAAPYKFLLQMQSFLAASKTLIQSHIPKVQSQMWNLLQAMFLDVEILLLEIWFQVIL